MLNVATLLMLQLGSFYGNDEAEPNSERGWLTHDPCFDPNVGHVQSRERESEFPPSFTTLIQNISDLSHPSVFVSDHHGF